MFLNVVLENDVKDQLDRSREDLRRVTLSQRGEEDPTYTKTGRG
jgi:hypothetical protein